MDPQPRRRTIVVAIVLGVVPFFAGVNALVGSARTRRQQLAIEWAARGGRDLAAGRAGAAVDDYRTAQEYARDSNAYRMQLANALVAGHHLNEARAQLQTLWAEEPGNGEVNLQLGRIAAAQGDETEAIRAYHAAIDGAWESSAADARREARLELGRFLIRRGDTTMAQAELIALSDDLPPDAGAIVETAGLLVQAGAPQRALTVVDRALKLDPTNARALRLAGACAFALGDYRRAARDLDGAARQAPLDAADERLRHVSTRVLALDPQARGISSRARVRRIAEDFQLAAAWLDRCPSDANPDLKERLASASGKATERDLLRDPDLADATLALAADVAAAAGRCAAPTDDETALDLVLEPHRSAG
jgi:tetratricopeptide (TPR) repeat protein